MDMNKPVAWLFVLDGYRCVTLDEDASYETQHNGAPLYTHPVKELSDEEIEEVWYDTQKNIIGNDVVKFARAILRKAQEK